MEKLMEKISRYHLINYIVPGALAMYLSERLNGVNLLTDKIAFDFIIMYIVGLVCSRVGSILVEPLLKKIGLISFAPYKNFVQAEKKDAKLSELNADNNVYRTFIGVLLLVSLQSGFLFVESKYVFVKDYSSAIIITALLVLFVFSYRKQSKYVKERVEKNLEDNS